MFDMFRDPDQEHTDSVPHDRFDRAMWDEVREDAEPLDTLVSDLRRKYDYVEDFSLDVFNLLAKGDPELRSFQDMRATHVPNRQIVQDLASLPELQSLRQFTIGDGFSSAMGLLSLREQIQHALAKADDLREQAEAAQEAREKAQEAASDAESNPGDPSAQDAAEQAAEAAEQALQQLQAKAEAASAGTRNGMRQALVAAAKDAEETQETMHAYGVGPGDLERMNFADRAALAKRLSGGKLKDFARIVGSFRQLATAEYRRRVTDAADETIGVEFGSDLTRLTTQELINLASPELEDDFWHRYAENGLLVKRLRGVDRQGKGPIVYIGDESGTMNGAGEMWMKGLALALLDQATRQKRDFHYIGFAGTGSLREFTFPAGRTNRLDVLAMAEGFLNGGTDFATPLRRAMELLAGTEDKRPDVVFVTDGQAPLPPFIDEWNAHRQRLSARAYGIFVTSGSGGMPAALAAMTDDIRTVADLTDVSQVRDIMRQS
jgi:uncharacterized protein with von Willebrand factor type A (vWA) domain